jgi:diguanylate cyclase (GGDEF)-like protein
MNRPTEIALIAAGIDEEYQRGVIDGVIDYAKKKDINISCFSCFCGVVSDRGFDIGENNIYNLINYKMFDGVILMINTIPDVDVKQKLVSVIKTSMLPVVVFDCDEYPQFMNVTINNKKAMSELVSHIIEVHGANDIAYLSGAQSNPEAVKRYEAFCEVMTAAGKTIDPDRIMFGEFRPSDGKVMAEKLLKSGRKLPDALICANDATALSAIKEFEDRGYNIPKDIIVTGFDNIYNARHHYPALTTVERPLAEAGYSACEILLNAIEGKSWERVRNLDAKLVLSESCGCVSTELSDINAYRRYTYNILDYNRSKVRLLNSIISETAETDTPEDCMRVIGNKVSELDCDRFCICLCDDWISSYNVKIEDSLIHGYTPKMSAPLIWNKGEISEVKCFRSSNIAPRNFETGGNISYYLPLHFRERCLGYAIITNSEFPTRSLVCHSLIMSISQSLEDIRKLMNLNSVIDELDKLYVIDPLCNIYNRNGFVRAADSVFNECRMLGQKLLISFVDMDGLKYINDNYGHSEGDFALKTLATIISESCDEGMICARFGGDEFIVIGLNAEEEDIEKVESAIKTRVEQTNKTTGKPYKVECSIGTLVTRIADDMTLFKLITKADEEMYKEKKRKNYSRYLRRY